MAPDKATRPYKTDRLALASPATSHFERQEVGPGFKKLHDPLPPRLEHTPMLDVC